MWVVIAAGPAPDHVRVALERHQPFADALWFLGGGGEHERERRGGLLGGAIVDGEGEGVVHGRSVSRTVVTIGRK
jgi:hypothetical protein